MPNGRYVPCRNPFSERGPDPPHRRSAASATAKDKTVLSSCSEEDTPDLRSKYGTCRNPTTGRMPRRTRLTRSARHFWTSCASCRFRRTSSRPRRPLNGLATAMLALPDSATYSPNRRTTETRHMNRTRPSGIRLCERHTRNAPPVPFRAEAGATRAPQDAIPYMTLQAKPTSVLPTSIAVSTAVQYGQPLTGNYSIEITTAKAALAERLLTILVSAA